MNELSKVFKEAKPGDIFLSQGRGLFSKLVCWVLRSKYSHTFVKLSDTSIIEANDIGVTMVDAEKFLNTCRFIENIGFPAGSSTRILFLSNLKFLLGHKYDTGILLGGLLSRIWHRSRRHEGLLNAKDQYTCSELVATALLRCGFILPFPPSQITPEDLYCFITEQLAKYTIKE